MKLTVATNFEELCAVGIWGGGEILRVRPLWGEPKAESGLLVRTIDLFSLRCDGYAPAYAYELLDLSSITQSKS